MKSISLRDEDIKDNKLILNQYIESIFLEISKLKKFDLICVNCKELVINNYTGNDIKIKEISGSVKILRMKEVIVKKCVSINHLILTLRVNIIIRDIIIFYL